MLDDYVEHLEKTKNKSMLARIFGIFRVRTPYFSKLDVIVMQNTSNYFDKKKMKYSFDLKGSLVNRRVAFDMSAAINYVNYLPKRKKDLFGV